MRRLVQRVPQVEPEVPAARLVEQRPEQPVAVPLEAQRAVQLALVPQVLVRLREQRQVQQQRAR